MGFSTVPDDVQYITSTLLLEVQEDSGKLLWYKTNVAAVLPHSFSHVISLCPCICGGILSIFKHKPLPHFRP